MTERVLNYRYIGRNLKEGDVGLELEVEADQPLPSVTGAWKSKEEGSLRGYSMEYVTNGPILCDDNKFQTIKQLTDEINRPEYRVNKASPRTSLHVHVNVGKLTPNQTWTAATAYWLFENLLMEYCGESRKGNLFCLRAKDAEGSIRTCTRDLRSKTPFTTLKTDIIRYAAQNMNAIPKFGSIEYRGMCGTTDAEVIDTWSTQLHNLVRNSSLHFSNPSELLDRYYATSNKAAFLGRFFDPGFVQRLTSMPGWMDMIDNNVDLLLEFAYYHSDWTKYQERLEDHFSKNPVPIIDPTRIPLGVQLTSEQMAIAMENNYPISYRRGTYKIPFVYNAEGFKTIDWEDDGNMYVHGVEEDCPHIPWETRPATPEPIVSEDIFTATENATIHQQRLNDFYRANFRPLVPYPIPISTQALAVDNMSLGNTNTIIDDIAATSIAYDPQPFDIDDFGDGHS